MSDAAIEQEVRARPIRSMFSAIAPRYDFLNHLLSLNRDKSWRRRAVDLLLSGGPERGRYLDACAGTLDLSVEIAKRSRFKGNVIASDFSLPMLQAGVSKQRNLSISTACGDALQQPFADATFDGGIVGFGVRNLTSIEAGLAEFARLIRPGGRLVILEFTTPGWQPFRGLYLFYFRVVLPAVGRIISGHNSAYSYLPESVLKFPEPRELAARIERAGFRDVRWDTYTGGIVAAHVATRA